jgi:predicted phage terminase large subunit-like protein
MEDVLPSESIEGLKKEGKRDLLFFAADILGYGKPRSLDRPYLFLDASPDSPHRRLAEFIQSADASGVTESLDLEPRGFLKSTIGTIAYTLWCLARDPEEAILIVASTMDKAEMFLSEIKGQLETNTRLIGLFPGLAPHHRGPWQSDRIRVEGRTLPRKEPSIRAMGLDQGKAGGHHDRIVCDDLHDEANCNTAEQCQKVIIAYQRLRPLLVDQRRGEIRVTGTRWHGADLYGHLLERNEIARSKGKPEPIMVRITKLRKEDGTPEWPGMYDEAEIQRLKDTLDSELYYSQYENDPFTESQQIFKRSDIDKAWVDESEVPYGEMTFFTAVDPAQATNRWNDYSAVVTWGVFRAPDTRFGYLVTVVDAFRQRVETGALVDEIYAVHEAWKPVVISIEAQSCESTMKYTFREEGKKRGMIPWRTINRGGHTGIKGKQRIRRIEPYIRNGTLRLVRGGRGMNELVRELQDYPRGAHDDAIDALADFPEISFAPSSGEVPRNRFNGVDGSKATSWKRYMEIHEGDLMEGDVPLGIVVGKH